VPPPLSTRSGDSDTLPLLVEFAARVNALRGASLRSVDSESADCSASSRAGRHGASVSSAPASEPSATDASIDGRSSADSMLGCVPSIGGTSLPPAAVRSSCSFSSAAAPSVAFGLVYCGAADGSERRCAASATERSYSSRYSTISVCLNSTATSRAVWPLFALMLRSTP
jgi:hypothetical protein